MASSKDSMVKFLKMFSLRYSQDMFHRIQFRAIWRERDKLDRLRHTQFPGSMPACAIKQHETEVSCQGLLCVRKKNRHGFRIDPGHDERGKTAVQRTYGGHGIDVFPDHLMPHYRPTGQRRPTSPEITDTSEATLILAQEAYRHA